MFQYYFPVVFVVVFNALYHICSKQIPQDANPLALLVVTYIVAAVTAFVGFMIMDHSHDFIGQIKAITWAPIALGVCIVGLEFGFILIYRVGWNISLASLVCNIALATVLLALGIAFYKENLNANQIIGVALCAAGLVFINKG